VLLPGGDDHGLDGISGDGEWGLVATTGDGLSNLRKNLKRHLETDGATRRILFATPRKLSNAQRRNLVAAASNLGFDLTPGQVYEQKAFTERLYRDSAWRKQLLGIPGAPPALSEYPTSLRPTIDIPLVGRESELSRLTSATGDILLVGEPGTGKTFLTQALVSEGQALFVVDFDRERLTDAIRDLSPQRIIIEDVHFLGAEAFADIAHLRPPLVTPCRSSVRRGQRTPRNGSSCRRQTRSSDWSRSRGTRSWRWPVMRVWLPRTSLFV